MVITSVKLQEKTNNITDLEVKEFVERHSDIIKSIIVLQRMNNNQEDINDWECALAPLIF